MTEMTWLATLVVSVPSLHFWHWLSIFVVASAVAGSAIAYIGPFRDPIVKRGISHDTKKFVHPLILERDAFDEGYAHGWYDAKPDDGYGIWWDWPIMMADRSDANIESYLLGFGTGYLARRGVPRVRWDMPAGFKKLMGALVTYMQDGDRAKWMEAITEFMRNFRAHN